MKENGVYIITIDMGTSNTRVMLWDQNKKLVAKVKMEVGAHVTAMDGNDRRLKETVKTGISQVILDGGISFKQIRMVLASGMITSELGLYEVPHVLTPAGSKELASGIVERCFEELDSIPILLIPGIKNRETAEQKNINMLDMMRGEEAEAVGLISHLPKGNSYILIFPGSHTKVIQVNEYGQIIACMTTLGGELLESVTKYTILSDAAEKEFVKEQNYQKELILEGQREVKQWGVTRALFLARVRKNCLKQSASEIQNYLLGVIVQSDVEAIKKWIEEKHMTNSQIIITGRAVIRRAFGDIMKSECGDFDLYEYPDNLEIPFSAEGAMIIGEEYCKIK